MAPDFCIGDKVGFDSPKCLASFPRIGIGQMDSQAKFFAPSAVQVNLRQCAAMCYLQAQYDQSLSPAVCAKVWARSPRRWRISCHSRDQPVSDGDIFRGTSPAYSLNPIWRSWAATIRKGHGKRVQYSIILALNKIGTTIGPMTATIIHDCMKNIFENTLGWSSHRFRGRLGRLLDVEHDFSSQKWRGVIPAKEAAKQNVRLRILSSYEFVGQIRYAFSNLWLTSHYANKKLPLPTRTTRQ